MHIKRPLLGLKTKQKIQIQFKWPTQHSYKEESTGKSHRGPQKTTKVDDSRILSLMKKNPFNNIQPSQECSRGGGCPNVKVYNQETPS